MAQAVAEKKQVNDEEFDIHGNLANQAGSDSFVVLYDSAEGKQNGDAINPPSLEDLNETQVIAADNTTEEASAANPYIDEILSSDDLEPATPVAATAEQRDEDDGPIALTNEELDGILEMGPQTDEEFHPDFPVESNEELAPPPLPPVTPENMADLTHSNAAVDEEEELPIAISDEDLDEILLEEEGGPLSPPPPPPHPTETAGQQTKTPTDETTLPTSETITPTPTDAVLPDEEPIALSDDELDHILADAEEDQAELAPELTSHTEDEILTFDDDSGPTLIDDAGPTLEPAAEDHPAPEQSTNTGFFDSDDDEPITLSDEELDGILSTAPEEEATTPSDEIALPPSPQPESVSVEDDEPISLSHEELDGILVDATEAPEQAAPPPAEPAANEGKGFFDSDEDEPIALSAEELDGIVATATTEETNEAPVDLDSRYADVDSMPEQEAPATSSDAEEDGPIALSADELEGIAADAREVTPEAPMVGLAPLDASPTEPSLAEQSDKPATVFEEDLETASLIHEDGTASTPVATGPDTEELKSVMSYLDNLLGELPDDVIEKFAQSEYFKLYQKIMDKLGL